MILVAYVAAAMTPIGFVVLLAIIYLGFTPFYLFRPDCVDSCGRLAIRLAAILFIFIGLTFAILFVCFLAGVDLSFLGRDHTRGLETAFTIWVLLPLPVFGVLLALVASGPQSVREQRNQDSEKQDVSPRGPGFRA